MLGAAPLGGEPLGGEEAEARSTSLAVEVIYLPQPTSPVRVTSSVVEVWATVENLVPSPNGTVLLIGF